MTKPVGAARSPANKTKRKQPRPSSAAVRTGSRTSSAPLRAPKRKDGARSRDGLLRAAILCVAQRGVVAVKVADVVGAAQASPSSFYHFYPDLQALYADVLIDIFQRLFAALTSAVVGVARRVAVDATGGRALVRALVEQHVDWTLQHRSDAFTMYQLTAIELAPEHVARVTAAKAPLYAPIAIELAPFMTAKMMPAWSPIEFDVVVMGPAHEALRRFLAGAPIGEQFLRNTLPHVAASVAFGTGR